MTTDTYKKAAGAVVMPADRILRTKDLIRPGEKIYIGYFGGDSTEHKHEFIERVYVVSGTAKHLHEGEKSRIKPGDCFLIDIGSRHGYCEATQDFTIINCLFTPSFLSGSLKDDQLFKSLACNVFVTMESAGKQGRIFASRAAAPGVYAVLMQMINEFRDKKEGYLEILQALLKVALIYIFRGIETAPGPKIVTDIIEYIYAACDKKLNVETLGEWMFFSPAYISRVFKKYTGRNLSEYIREKRMENVAQKLSHTDESIESIMREAGYGDKKSFYEQFSRMYGCTPGEYRRRMG